MTDPVVAWAIQVVNNAQEIERLAHLVEACYRDRDELETDRDSSRLELEKLTRQVKEQEEVVNNLTALLIHKTTVLEDTHVALNEEKRKQDGLKAELRRLVLDEVDDDGEAGEATFEESDVPFGATSPPAQNSPTDVAGDGGKTKLHSGELYCCPLCYASMVCHVTGRRMSDVPLTDTVTTLNPRRRKVSLKSTYNRDIIVEKPIEELPIQRRDLYCFTNPLYIMEQYMDMCSYKISMQHEDKMDHICRLLFTTCGDWFQHMDQHLPEHSQGDLRDLGIVPDDWKVKNMISNWQLKQNNTDVSWFQGDEKDEYRKFYNSLCMCVMSRTELPPHEFTDITFFDNGKRQRQ